MIKSTKLSWLVVSDINEAKDFYINKLGLILKSENLEYKWLEVSLIDNSYLIGISEYNANHNDHYSPKPGSGIVMTFEVENLEKTINEYKSKNIQFIGKIQEIPGHVKMITIKDNDGNIFQICQKLD